MCARAGASNADNGKLLPIVMKTLFFAMLVFLGIVVAAPQAEARSRHVRFYDGYARPVVHVGYSRYYPVRAYYRPAYTYYRPLRAYYRDYDYCGPRVRYYAHRPRFSFFFGF
jgi:hypothetical protein